MSASELKRRVARINSTVQRIEQKEVTDNPFFLPFLYVKIKFNRLRVTRSNGTTDYIERYSYELGEFGNSKEIDREKLFDDLFLAIEKGKRIFVLFAVPQREQLTQLRIKYAKEPLIIKFEDKKNRVLEIPYYPNDVFGGNVPQVGDNNEA